MKITMIVNNLEVSGGYQKLVIRLAEQLSKFGHDVTTYTPYLNKKNCYPKDISSLRIVSLRDNEKNGTLVDMYERLVTKIDNSFDALIIHDELSLIAVALLPQRKSVWMLNNQLSNRLGKYYPEMRSVFIQRHARLRDRINDTREAYRRTKLMRQGLKKIERFATYDSFNKDLVEKYLNRKADIVYAGADLDRFKKLAKNRHFKKKHIYGLLSVGVVFPHRRYEDLIEATSQVNEDQQLVKTVIIGRQDLSPVYYHDLQDLAQRQKLGTALKFVNYASDQEMLDYYNDSDVFIFINDGFTWGIAVFEAVAAKLPVIITDNIGAVDLIKPGETGWVVPPQNPRAVALAIKDILSNPERAQKITESAYRSIEDTVSWHAYAKRMEKLIQQ